MFGIVKRLEEVVTPIFSLLGYDDENMLKIITELDREEHKRFTLAEVKQARTALTNKSIMEHICNGFRHTLKGMLRSEIGKSELALNDMLEEFNNPNEALKRVTNVYTSELMSLDNEQIKHLHIPTKERIDDLNDKYNVERTTHKLINITRDMYMLEKASRYIVDMHIIQIQAYVEHNDNANAVRMGALALKAFKDLALEINKDVECIDVTLEHKTTEVPDTITYAKFTQALEELNIPTLLDRHTKIYNNVIKLNALFIELINKEVNNASGCINSIYMLNVDSVELPSTNKYTRHLKSLLIDLEAVIDKIKDIKGL